ncbi:MAG: MATE family efflux transporter [Clostridiales bacterium]|nr:MATE family efflux transporter [Clostridiales bacterium]
MHTARLGRSGGGSVASRLKGLFSAQDMTVGVIWRKLAMFAVPLLVGNIVQQLYSTVDSIVVGKYVGDEALAAVGASFPLFNLLLILFMGISTGAGIMVSQYFGAKQRDELSRTIGTTILLLLLSSAVIMAIGPAIARPLLVLLQTPANILDACAEYMVILFIGISGIAFYNGISGILRGMGDSLMPLVFLSITCLLNIVLDVWFVAGFGWGVAGAAWATVIAQWISSVLCVIRLARMNDVFDWRLRYIRLDRRLSPQLGKLGMPAALTQMIFSLANIVVQTLTNSFGSDVIACATIVMRVDGFAMMPNFTFGMAMSTFVGQNAGAGKMDRVDKGARAGARMGVAVSVALVALMLVFGRALMRIFTNTGPVVELSYRMLCILSPGYVAMAVMQILCGVMRGAGDTMSPMWISMITTVAVRTPVVYLLAYMTRSDAYPNGRPEVLMVSLLVAWGAGAVLSAALHRRGAWRAKTIVGRKNAAAEPGG